jgi:DNA repair protein RadC
MKFKRLATGEKPGTYEVIAPVTEEEILDMAGKLAKKKLAKGRLINNPSLAFSHIRTLIQNYEYEVFCALFLDTRNRVIRFEELFKGTLDAASVYPREVVKRALELNAAAVIFAHNHPSGDPEPSQSDIRITQRLREALALIDIRTLDHVVVGVDGCVSLAERGQI